LRKKRKVVVKDYIVVYLGVSLVLDSMEINSYPHPCLGDSLVWGGGKIVGGVSWGGIGKKKKGKQKTTRLGVVFCLLPLRWRF